MKRKEINNLINSSIQKNTPKLTKKILSAPINVSNNAVEVKAEKQRAFVFNKPAVKWISAVACVLVVIVVASILGVAFAPKNVDTPVTTLQTTCYQIDINPSILVTTDKDGKVLHVSSCNDDGDVVLSGEVFDEYEGMNIEEFVKVFVDESAKLGYVDLSDQNNEMTITVVNGEDQGKLQTIANTLSEKIQNYLRESNIYMYVKGACQSISDFIKDLGFENVGNNMDNYLEQLESKNKFFSADSISDSFISDIENQLRQFVDELRQKKDLLNQLDNINDKIDELCGHDYWLSKSNYQLGIGDYSQEVISLIEQGNSINDQLYELDLNIYSSIKLNAQLVKYEIIDDIIIFVEDIDEYLKDKSFLDVILIFISEEDKEFYIQLQEKLTYYYEEVVEKIENIYEERIGKYLDSYLNRPQISEDDYDDFLASKN